MGMHARAAAIAGEEADAAPGISSPAPRLAAERTRCSCTFFSRRTAEEGQEEACRNIARRLYQRTASMYARACTPPRAPRMRLAAFAALAAAAAALLLLRRSPCPSPAGAPAGHRLLYLLDFASSPRLLLVQEQDVTPRNIFSGRRAGARRQRAPRPTAPPTFIRGGGGFLLDRRRSAGGARCRKKKRRTSWRHFLSTAASPALPAALSSARWRCARFHHLLYRPAWRPRQRSNRSASGRHGAACAGRGATAARRAQDEGGGRLPRRAAPAARRRAAIRPRISRAARACRRALAVARDGRRMMGLLLQASARRRARRARAVRRFLARRRAYALPRPSPPPARLLLAASLPFHAPARALAPALHLLHLQPSTPPRATAAPRRLARARARAATARALPRLFWPPRAGRRPSRSRRQQRRRNRGRTTAPPWRCSQAYSRWRFLARIARTCHQQHTTTVFPTYAVRRHEHRAGTRMARRRP